MTRPAPIDHFAIANGLRHHIVEWAPEAAPSSPPASCVWLSHGFMDFAYSWTRVAEKLQDAGYRVFAHDWRGHGETDWIGPGGYYHFADYALDLEQLLPAVLPADCTLHLVGHSMGATATAMYAGVRPERPTSVTLIEGLGPPNTPEGTSVSRFKSWFKSVERIREKVAAREPGTGGIADIDEALTRMRVRNSQLKGEFEHWGRFLAEKATKQTPDGRRAWRFDPLHRTISPIPFRVELFTEFLRGITAPTLVVLGSKGYRLPDADEAARLSAIANHDVLEIEGAGHMIPWFNDDVFCPALVAHLSRSEEPDSASQAG